MANDCTNRLSVKGPGIDVLAFVESAKGPYDPAWLPGHPTEVAVVRAVNKGKPLDEALRDANERIARIRDAHGLEGSGDGRPAVAIPEDISFGTWGRWAGFDICGDRKPRTSHLSLPTLVPVPAEVLAESYDLVGHDWVLRHWGVKWGIGAEAPDLLVGKEAMTATYGDVESPNSAPVAAVAAMSESWPTLTFVLASHFVGEGDVVALGIRAGARVAEVRAQESDYPPVRTPIGEDLFTYHPEPMLREISDRTWSRVA